MGALQMLVIPVEPLPLYPRLTGRVRGLTPPILAQAVHPHRGGGSCSLRVWPAGVCTSPPQIPAGGSFEHLTDNCLMTWPQGHLPWPSMVSYLVLGTRPCQSACWVASHLKISLRRYLWLLVRSWRASPGERGLAFARVECLHLLPRPIT